MYLMHYDHGQDLKKENFENNKSFNNAQRIDTCIWLIVMHKSDAVAFLTCNVMSPTYDGNDVRVTSRSVLTAFALFGQHF